MVVPKGVSGAVLSVVLLLMMISILSIEPARAQGVNAPGMPRTSIASQTKLGAVGSSTTGTAVPDANPPPLPPGEEIYDLRKPYPVPFPWQWYAWRGLALMFAFWLLSKLWAVLLRERVSEATEEPDVPPPDPLEEALAALHRLRESSLWREGRYKDICEHLALVLKVFLHDRFNLGIGAAATVSELVRDLRRQAVDPGLCRQAEDLLELFDSVKYAAGDLRGIPLETLHDKILGLIRREDWQA